LAGSRIYLAVKKCVSRRTGGGPVRWSGWLFGRQKTSSAARGAMVNKHSHCDKKRCIWKGEKRGGGALGGKQRRVGSGRAGKTTKDDLSTPPPTYPSCTHHCMHLRCKHSSVSQSNQRCPDPVSPCRDAGISDHSYGAEQSAHLTREFWWWSIVNSQQVSRTNLRVHERGA